jgi:acetoin utilization deacetylase AcuC-like enzyme
MTTQVGFFCSDTSLAHRNKPRHPESEQRAVAIQTAIAARPRLNQILVPQPARLATNDEICLAHHPGYVEDLLRTCAGAERDNVLKSLDEDTSVSPGSRLAAWTAAGMHLAAIDALLSGQFQRCYVLGRPPGHHARRNKAKGFCLLNNIAIAALYALSKGCKCILIIDWDAHHGDGTQEFFWGDVRVVVISIQQRTQLGTDKTMWPHSGDVTEDGKTGEAKGKIVNLPFTGGSGDDVYLPGWDQVVEPIAMGLDPKPDLVLLSDGKDAHEKDTVCQQRVSTPGFRALAARAHRLAHMLGKKPMLGTLEGGYRLEALAETVPDLLEVWGTDPSDTDAMAQLLPDQGQLSRSYNPAAARADIDAAVAHHANYHKSLRPHAT